jgi:predicted RNase H-like nuclease (RuvC/YqgF family)
MTLEEEVVLFREENKRLRDLLEQALARIAKLEAQLEQAANSLSPPLSYAVQTVVAAPGRLVSVA